MRRDVRGLKMRKAPGTCWILVKMLKAGGESGGRMVGCVIQYGKERRGGSCIVTGRMQ